jgi:hypothetical protein
MLEAERKNVDKIAGVLARMEAGELTYSADHKKLGAAILNYLKWKKDWIDWLMAFQPRTPKAEAELSEAIADYNNMITMNNRVAKFTAATNAKRNEEAGHIDWRDMASFSGGWSIPVSSGDGMQTWVSVCCTCGAQHLEDFRVVDGLVETRTFSVKEKIDAGIQAKDGARAHENGARAGKARAPAKRRRAGAQPGDDASQAGG